MSYTLFTQPHHGRWRRSTDVGVRVLMVQMTKGNRERMHEGDGGRDWMHKKNKINSYLS